VYRTLIAALKDRVSRITREGKSSSDYSLLVHTDSQLVVGQLIQGWKVKAANLRPLVDEAAATEKEPDPSPRTRLPFFQLLQRPRLLACQSSALSIAVIRFR